MRIYELELLKGSYRMLWWLDAEYGRKGYLRSRDVGNSWTVRAAKDLGYTQPMVSMICSDLVKAGVFHRTTGGFNYEI